MCLVRFERDPDVFARAQTRLKYAYEMAQASKLVMSSRPPPDFENADSWPWDDCKSNNATPETYERLAWIYMRRLRGENIPFPEAVSILTHLHIYVIFSASAFVRQGRLQRLLLLRQRLISQGRLWRQLLLLRCSHQW